MSRLRPALLLACVVCLLPASAYGQELRIKREIPAVAWAGCPATPAALPVPASQRLEAEQLASAATQAAILGDIREAADLLARATATDPTSASIAYRHARAEHDLGRTDRAITAYCRYLAVAPDAQDAADVRARIDELAAPDGIAVDSAAIAAFQAGLAHYDAARLQAADSAFGHAAAAAPVWADPVYNRALVRLALDQRDDAAEDLRRYLEMNPGSADFNRVLDVLGALRGVVPVPFNPGNVLAAGLLVPGLGHFTTGRTQTGLMYLGGASIAVLAGMAVTRVSVDCLAPPADGVCPPDQVLRENTSRPYLMPGIAAALAVGVWGAIDAYRGAQMGNRRAAELLRIGGVIQGAVLVAVPELQRGRDIRVELLRIQF